RADDLFNAIKDAGHHTTIQHVHFVFGLDGISRQSIWAFLHDHPYYNSEQVSQRYVEMKQENFLRPQVDERFQKKFETLLRYEMETYADLEDILRAPVSEEWYKVWTGRQNAVGKTQENYQKQIKKRIQEMARYALPVAALAHMYHTINAVTLFRYHIMAEQGEVPAEGRIIINKMLEAVEKRFPSFIAKIRAEDTMPIEKTPEYTLMKSLGGELNPYAAQHSKELKAKMNGAFSRLETYQQNAEETLAEAVRDVMGVPASVLNDDDAIDAVMNPAKNKLFGAKFNLTTLSDLTRSLNLVQYGFRTRISHTADSQNQRHRTIQGPRPLLQRYFDAKNPDCIWPKVFEQSLEASERVKQFENHVWREIGDLLSDGLPWEAAQYALPNATAINFHESGDLLNWAHKWHMRLCFNAQEEIWRASQEQVIQIAAVHPRIAKHLGAPCHSRVTAGAKPVCPEGDKYCGVAVWRTPVADGIRVI
ncbi:MAG: FAD-dependent thymidylate synthase, partial [Nanoarchaeota archaeon]